MEKRSEYSRTRVVTTFDTYLTTDEVVREIESNAGFVGNYAEPIKVVITETKRTVLNRFAVPQVQ